MKLQTIQQGNARRRSPVTPLLVSLALVSGALALGTGPVLGEGGGGSGDQGVPRNYQSPGEARFGSNYNGGQADRGRSVDRQSRNYGDRNSRAQRYDSGSQRHYAESPRYSGRSYRSYSYGDPAYIYGPGVYDANPSPGIGLFFNF
jgi:hypothetical protein